MPRLILLAMDPGDKETAWVRYDGLKIWGFAKEPNQKILEYWTKESGFSADHLAIETLKPRGMPTSFEEMQMQLWAGRFIQASGLPFTQIFRMEEKIALCGKSNAKDSNIRQALIDRWGGASAIEPERKCGQCKGKGWVGRGRPTCDLCKGTGEGTPAGALAGISGDCWQALAVAVTWFEKHHNGVAQSA